MTVVTRASAILRNRLSFTGNVPTSDAGATVLIQRMGRQTGWAWTTTAQAPVAQDGSFTASWHTDHIGRFAIRAVVATTGTASRAHAADTSPTLTVTVYRPSIATLYGPGFYGHKTACGQVLKPGTIGVANRTLPCGTAVAVYYKGQTIVVPVIDRGPYANRADWDLTVATAQALGISGTSTIGAVSLPAQSSSQ
jgi:rare lipoprotein A (peptidoglycan hydrolase)